MESILKLENQRWIDDKIGPQGRIHWSDGTYPIAHEQCEWMEIIGPHYDFRDFWFIEEWRGPIHRKGNPISWVET